MKEIFFDVPSFRGRLKISRSGKVLSLITGKILRLSVLPTGYITLILMMKNPRRSKTLYLHRLLAETFIKNPNNKPQVNHKNGIKKDNSISNLEWCTQSENNFHAVRVLGHKRNVSGLTEWREKKRALNAISN
jgi:hypothetical protein